MGDAGGIINELMNGGAYLWHAKVKAERLLKRAARKAAAKSNNSEGE